MIEVTGGAVSLAQEGEGRTLVVLAHGAGGNLDSKNILRLRNLLLEQGVSVARFNFLYREQKRGIPDRMPVLMQTYREVVAHLRNGGGWERVILAGHSMGGRTASMVAAEGDPMDGLLLFSYPLHPVGQPEKLRDTHLPEIRVPTLCINGTQDEFCERELMEAVLPRLAPTWKMHWVEAANHSLEVRKASGRTNAEVGEELKSVLADWLAGPI